MSKEFSCTSFSTTSLKQRIDKESLKNSRDVDKDFNVAQKIADRINYDVKANNGKLSLDNRFELVAMGYELKSKIKKPDVDRDISIYRKEKRNETFNSPPTAFEGYGVHKPVLSSARGFYRNPSRDVDSGVEARSSASSSSHTSSPSFSTDRMFFGRKPTGFSKHEPQKSFTSHRNNNSYNTSPGFNSNYSQSPRKFNQSFGERPPPPAPTHCEDW